MNGNCTSYQAITEGITTYLPPLFGNTASVGVRVWREEEALAHSNWLYHYRQGPRKQALTFLLIELNTFYGLNRWDRDDSGADDGERRAGTYDM